MILHEEDLIKGWRKYDNKLRRAIIDRIYNDEKLRVVYAGQLKFKIDYDIAE